MTILYLHGLGSSPASGKAHVVKETFATRGVPIVAPDLNIPSFEELSVHGALASVREALEDYAAAGSVLLIGSSFGAFLAVHALHGSREEHRKKVAALILLAPALDPWWEGGGLLTSDRDAPWRSKGRLPLYHHAFQREILVHYEFVRELTEVGRPEGVQGVPTTIVHGVKDNVVPVEVSRAFAARSTQVTLHEVDEGHDLLGDKEELARLLRKGAAPYFSSLSER